MKYGETLQRRSIAAWRAHNIDYDEIKRFIKQRTTASGSGKSESISVPGRGGSADDKLSEFDDELSQIFAQQHERINLFVRSKVGEIKRRLEHAKRQLRQLSSQRRKGSSSTTADRRIPIARLERYSRLENDVVKIGDEVRSLARFTNTNRTAFRKLIKKARKWSQSDRLCEGFRASVLHGEESYLDLDFAPLLEDYSATLAKIRGLYESRIKPASATKPELDFDPTAGTSITQRLQAATKTGSKVDFDTAIATIPLGESGDIANYFVHPEYAVELQVLLLNHVQPYAGRSRHNSLARSSSGNLTNGIQPGSSPKDQDYFMLVADNIDRFAKVESAVTVNEREHSAGVIPQRAKYFLRWTNDEDAVLASRAGSAKIQTASLKRKHADTFFDVKSSQRRESDATLTNQSLATVREEISKDKTVRPLYKISSRRDRFTGVSDGIKSVTLATLDSQITLAAGEQTTSEVPTSTFPFAVLQVRTEGEGSHELIKTLDDSHLVERVRGFSLQYHALWQTCNPDNMSPPFWMDILSRDIRKLPPPAQARNDSLVPRGGSGSGNGSAKQQSTGTNSVRGLTDETTAVDTPRPSSSTAPADQLETPPLKAFRKKRRRKYPDHLRPDDTPPRGKSQQQRYWNEYDNPEDGGEGGGGTEPYWIYVNPDERDVWDKFVDAMRSLFTLGLQRQQREREPDADPSGSTTPRDEESSSDEDETSTLNPQQRKKQQRNYGTASLPLQHHQPRQADPDLTPSIPQTTTLCLSASLAILVITFILAATSKHKYVRAVDAAIVFAIICSLVFAGVGFVALMGRRGRSGEGVGWGVVGVAAAVVLVDAVGCGGLLAWMLG